MGVLHASQVNERLRGAINMRQGAPPMFSVGDQVYARWFPMGAQTGEYKGRWFASRGKVTAVFTDGIRVKFHNDGGKEFDYPRAIAAQHVAVVPPDEQEMCVPREC